MNSTKGTLKKLGTLENARVRDDALAEVVGLFRLPPKVGRSFAIYHKEQVTDDGWLFGGDGRVTSPVTEITESTPAKIVFRTLNSTYELTFGAEA